MENAILWIKRVGESQLDFVLQPKEAKTGAFINAPNPLTAQEKEKFAKVFEDFAECVEGRDSDEPKLRELGRILYKILLPQVIRDQLVSVKGALTIVTDDPTIPWEIVNDGKDFLAFRYHLSRQVMITTQMCNLLEIPSDESISEALSVLIIADPQCDLPGAKIEGEKLYTLFQNAGKSHHIITECDLLLGKEATWQNVLRRLGSKPYSIIHFCGHVEYDPANSQSLIRLYDDPLNTWEVQTNFKGKPLVFLNACYSDLHISSTGTNLSTASFARTESFAAAFMMGNSEGVASAVIGTMWRIPDEPEEAGWIFSRTFYENLMKGERIASALRKSRVLARQKKWGPMVWGPYVLYSNPLFQPFAEIPKTSKRKTTARKDKEKKGKSIGDPKTQGSTQEEKRTVSEATAEKESTVLDTSARQIFLTAMLEMKQLNQRWLSSLHLLIGICKARIDKFDQLISEKNSTVALIAEEAKKRAKALIPEKDQAMGISKSVLEILTYAAYNARKRGEKTITGADLVVGLSAAKDAEALSILNGVGISREEIKNLFSARHTRRSRVTRFRYDGPTQEAIEHGLKTALNAGLDYFGTPHLLIGLIRTGGLRTISLLRERGVNLEQLCEVLLAGMGTGSQRASQNGMDFTLKYRPRCYRILQRAQELAEESSQKEITEVQLLQALLEEQEGFTAEVLRRMGADPTELLKTLESGPQDQ